MPASLAWTVSQGGLPARRQPFPYSPGLGKYEETGLPGGGIKEITPALLASGLTLQACKRGMRESWYHQSIAQVQRLRLREGVVVDA